MLLWEILQGSKRAKNASTFMSHHSRLQSETLEILEEELVQTLENESDLDISELDESNVEECFVKKGVKLPRTPQQWLNANDFFKAAFLNTPITAASLHHVVCNMNNVLYRYYKENYGCVNDSSTFAFVSQYKDASVRELKKRLKQLKLECVEISEIKYVSRLLRRKICKPGSLAHDINGHGISDHDEYIGKNFWGYVKNTFAKRGTPLPSFDKERCTEFFLKYFSAINKSKLFCITSWIPPFTLPQVPFNLDPPSYQQITNIILNMKSSGSPCPLDQLSMISFKRCPYLRIYITEIIKVVWSSGTLPNEWKKACTVLAHKKGDPKDPANFRPITLESIPLKVFTSALRNSIFDFLRLNSFVEHEIQKCFMPKLSWTLEHTSLMAHIIDRAELGSDPLSLHYLTSRMRLVRFTII